MLKRYLGLSLLAFLVITGLAGTVHHASISYPERKTVLFLFKDSRSGLLASIKGLNARQVNYKPAISTLSVKENVYQIILNEKRYWGLLKSEMKKPDNPEKRKEIKLTDKELLEMIESGNLNDQTPTEMTPANNGNKSLNEMVVEFKSLRAALIKYMKSTTEDLRNHVVKMPFGYIDCYQLSLLIAAQNNKQVQQINALKSVKDFPR